MSQPDDERRRLEEELARLRNTPSPEVRLEAGATVPRSRHPHYERVLARLQRDAEEIVDLFNPPEIRVDVAPSVIPAPQVTVEASVVPAPNVRVDVPDQSAAVNALAGWMGQVVELLKVLVEHETSKMPERKEVTFKRNSNGQITGATVTEN